MGVHRHGAVRLAPRASYPHLMADHSALRTNDWFGNTRRSLRLV